MGLINRVFADGELEAGVSSLVGELLNRSGAVMRLTVKGLRELSLRDFDASLKHRHFGFELKEYIHWLGESLEEWFFVSESKAMAREALNQAKKELLNPR